jgi:hypothetical protein
VRPRIVQYTPRGPLIVALGKRLANHYGGSFEWIGCRQPWSVVAEKVKGSDLVIIWSGLQRETGLCARLCRRRGIPCVFIEQGMLSQASTWSVDPQGFCGDSILNGDLAWINDHDMNQLDRMRRSLQQQYPLRPEPGRYLVPLQIENDAHVLFYSKYESMRQFAADLHASYGDRLVIRNHPRCHSRPAWPSRVDDAAPFLESARRAERVVGLTSTCLYEAAVLGVPVEAWGDHPFRTHPRAEHDRVAAGALAMRIARRGGELHEILNRFQISPHVTQQALRCYPDS